MSLDAMKLALEALQTNNKAWKQLADSGDAGFWKAEEQPFYETSVKAITALRAAIEQAQEPVAWVYPEALEAFKNGRPWTAYGSNGDGRIPLYLNDAVAQRVEPRLGESGAGFESLPASPNQPEKNNG